MASRYPVTLPPAAVTQETADNLRALAERLDRPVSWIVRAAVARYVEQHPAERTGRLLMPGPPRSHTIAQRRARRATSDARARLPGRSELTAQPAGPAVCVPASAPAESSAVRSCAGAIGSYVGGDTRRVNRRPDKPWNSG